MMLLTIKGVILMVVIAVDIMSIHNIALNVSAMMNKILTFMKSTLMKLCTTTVLTFILMTMLKPNVSRHLMEMEGFLSHNLLIRCNTF